MTLDEIGRKHGTDKSSLYHCFLDFYEQELKGKKIKSVLEIGIMDGASLKMWREYFPEAEIVGIDIRPTTPVEGVTSLVGDATDENFIKTLGEFDLIIDDGSHMTADQIKSFELLKPHLRKGGIYIVEDVHTSYRPNYVNSQRATDYFKGKYFWKTEDKTDSGTCLLHF